jgi:hypothetical protein
MKLDLMSNIATKLQRYQEAQCVLIETASAQQQVCKHELCWELPFQSYRHGGCSPARRICVHCRYEEEGSHWSGGSVWSRHDHSTSILAKSIVVERLALDQFCAKRLPVSVPDFHPSAIAEQARLEAERAQEQRYRQQQAEAVY